MKRLIWDDYKKDGFSPGQAFYLTEMSERLNKLFFAPSHGSTHIARSCNAMVERFTQFMDNVTPETADTVWADFFETFHEELSHYNFRRNLNFLEDATRLPLFIFENSHMTYVEKRDLWQDACFLTQSCLKNEAEWPEEVVRRGIEYKLIGKFQWEKDNANKDALAIEEESGKEALHESIQQQLETTSLALLVLPGNVLNKEQVYPKIMSRLRQASLEIDEATGWGAEALGLKGRIALMLGCLYDGTSGMCSARHSIGDSSIVPMVIWTSARDDNWYPKEEEEVHYLFEAFIHEWLHALDYLAHEVNFNNPFKKLRGDLKKFNEDLDVVNENKFIKKNAVAHYRWEVLNLIHNIFKEGNWVYTDQKAKKTERWLDDILKDKNLNEKLVAQFFEANPFISEKHWEAIALRISVTHKIKHEKWVTLPFLMRNEAVDQSWVANGERPYFTRPQERLAYSFQSALNWKNPLNWTGGYAPSEEECFELRKRWKKILDDNYSSFKKLEASYMAKLQAKSAPVAVYKEQAKEMFWWKMKSQFRKWKELDVNFDRNVALLMNNGVESLASLISKKETTEAPKLVSATMNKNKGP